MSYESPITNANDDKLARRSLASQIYKTIDAEDQDWAVRIAILGKWGEGKTSVANMVCDIASRQGSVYTTFNPWKVNNKAELILELTKCVVSALDNIENTAVRQVKHSLWKDQARNLISRISRIRKDTELISDEIVEGLWGSSLRSSAFEDLFKALGRKRVIVVIDDLDRWDPKIVPPLLLALRDVLDLPGFAFLLPFDADNIMKALQEYHPAWEDGTDFLDKIIDFRFPLPQMTEEEVHAFLIDVATDIIGVFGTELFDRIAGVLPASPRKIKKFVRHLRPIVDLYQRHDDDEFDWLLVFLLVFLKIEIGDTLKDLLAQTYFDSDLLSKLPQEDSRNGLSNRYDDYIRGIWHKGLPQNRQDLTDCFEELHKVSGDILRNESLRYAADLIYRPHCFTWREFKKLFELWRNSTDGKQVSQFIDYHADSIMEDRARVVQELFEVTLLYWRLQLEAASESRFLIDHESAMRIAIDTLMCIENLVKGGEAEGTDLIVTFRKVWEGHKSYFDFRKNPLDVKARDKEEEFLIELATEQSDQAISIASVLNERSLISKGDDFERFKDRLIEIIQPSIGRKVLDLFRIEKGFDSLDTERILVDRALYRKSSPIFQEPLLSELKDLLGSASEDTAVQGQCFEYLLGLLRICEGSSDVPAESREIVDEGELMEALWQATVSSPWQYRFWRDLVELRDRLIALTGEGTQFPMPSFIKES